MSDPAPTKAQAMKAVLTDERFSDPDWIYERKLDGVRCIAIRDGDRVRLLSRNDLSMNDRYPEVVEALEAQECRRFAIDGEVVAFDHGQTSFSRLARRGRERVAVFLYAFDITWLEGEDVRDRPLTERKRLLRDALAVRRPAAPERPPPRERRGVLRRGLPQGLGGADRQARRQPLHVGPVQGLAQVQVRARPGAGGGRLHAAARAHGRRCEGHRLELRYAGRGTGFDRRRWASGMAPLERDSSPFAERITGVAGATWAEPELVAEIGFTEWTRHGRLRHPRFLGLRFDKPASKVVREG